MDMLLKAIIFAIDLYEIAVFAYVVLSLLLDQGIVNASHEIIRVIWNFLVQIIEPALEPIRKRLPATGQLDFSPFILLILLLILKYALQSFLSPSFASLH